MYDKKRAIEFIKALMKEHKDLKLKVVDNAACWDKSHDIMTPLEWKHIGYVSALATAFDIIELE